MTGIATPPAPRQSGPPSSPRSRGLRLGLIIGISVLVTLVVIATVTALALPFALRSPVHQRLDLAAGASISVAVDDASFDVAPSDDGRIHVAVSGWSTVASPVSARTSQGRTTIDGGCPRIWFSPCSLHLTVTMPPIADLTVAGTNGGILTRGILGTIDAGTTNGTVDVRGAVGTLRLHSTNGGIRLSGAKTSTVTADTTNGAIDLTFTTVPASVDARATNGAITVSVPGSASYAVSAHTINGAVDTSRLSTDPTSPNRITAITINGMVRVQSSPR